MVLEKIERTHENVSEGVASSGKKTSHQVAVKVDGIGDRALDESVQQGLVWGAVSFLTFLVLCPLSVGPLAPVVGITAAVVASVVDYNKCFKGSNDLSSKKLHDTTKRA